MNSDDTLTLFIPELFGFQTALKQLPEKELPELPVLGKWLARGHISKVKSSIHHAVLNEFLSDIDNSCDNAESALCLLAEQNHQLDTSRSHWLRADPVHLLPDRDSAVMTAHDELELTENEAAQLVEEINLHFKEEPWVLHAPHPHRWYLQLEQAYHLQTHATGNVLGRNIDYALPTGNDASYWQRCINEMQMLLHASSVNIQRESTGNLPVTSVWIWGQGKLPEQPKTERRSVYADDLLVQGLAILSQHPVKPLSDSQSEQAFTKNSFFYLDQLEYWLTRNELFQFVATLKDIHDKWLLPSEQALKSGDVKNLRLITNGLEIEVSSRLVKKWWKRPVKFSHFDSGK